MKFNFKLQTVLDVKEKVLKQKQQELANLISKKINIRQQLNKIEEDIKLCTGNIDASDNFSSGEIKVYYEYYYELLDAKKVKEEELNEMELLINDKRNELLDQNKEIKALENLKEKKLSEFKFNLDKQTQALLDEIAVHSGKAFL